jgi:hypothetical protein
MYRETQIPGGGLTLLGVMALSFLMPVWVAGLLGLSEAHAALVGWMTLQEGIFWIALWLIYGAVGFFMLVGAAIGAVTAAIALMRGLTAATAWVLRSSHTMAEWLGELLYWPVQYASEVLWDALQQQRLRLCTFLHEQHELRRMYSEDYANDYPSFRAFLRAYHARQGDQELEHAIKLMGLPQPFTKDDVKRRFDQLIPGTHPDLVGPNQLAPQLIDAYKLIRRRKAWQ